MKAKLFMCLVIFLALSGLVQAQDKVKFEVGAGAVLLFNEEESDLFNGFSATLGVSYKLIGLQGEAWISGDGAIFGPSLVLNPLFRSPLSLFVLGGFLTSTEGGSAFIFGGGLKFMAVKNAGIRAEVRMATDTDFDNAIGVFSGSIFFRF